MSYARLINILAIFAFAAMLGWDGARLIAAVLHRNWPIAVIAALGAGLLGAIIHHLMTRNPRPDASQRTDP